jgi:hypothetical protein
MNALIDHRQRINTLDGTYVLDEYGHYIPEPAEEHYSLPVTWMIWVGAWLVGVLPIALLAWGAWRLFA